MNPSVPPSLRPSVPPSLCLLRGSAVFRLIEPHHQGAAEIVIRIDGDQIEESIALRLCDFGQGLQVGADAERAILQKSHPTFLFEYLRARFSLRFIGVVFPG